MPTTVMVVFHAVKVDPTFNLFLLASEAPTIATFDLEVEEKAVPAVSFSVPPPFAPPTNALPGLFVPITRTGTTNFVDDDAPFEPGVLLPAPNCPKRVPSDPTFVGDSSVVVDGVSSSLSDSCSAVT